MLLEKQKQSLWERIAGLHTKDLGPISSFFSWDLISSQTILVDEPHLRLSLCTIMNSTSVDALPEELQLSVFTCLGSPPPSELKSRQEPSLQLTSSQHHILKSISLVSKRWRRIILPLLFKHARLRVDITSRPEWVDCSICAATAFGNLQNDEAASFSVEQFHTDMMKAVRHRAAIVSSTSQMHGHSGGEHQEQSSEAATVIWASHVHHALADFLHFVQNRKLSSSIESVVLFAGRMLAPRIPQPCIIGDPRYSAAAVLWQELLSTIDPSRVTIMAPPTELVYLANAGTSSRTEYVVSHCNLICNVTWELTLSETGLGFW